MELDRIVETIEIDFKTFYWYYWYILFQDEIWPIDSSNYSLRKNFLLLLDIIGIVSFSVKTKLLYAFFIQDEIWPIDSSNYPPRKKSKILILLLLDIIDIASFHIFC